MTIQEELLADIDWRTAELAELRVILHKARLTSHQRATFLRYTIPAIYALWEGFVKNSIQLYTKLLHDTKIPIKDLHDSLATQAIHSDTKLTLVNPRTTLDAQVRFCSYIKDFLFLPFPNNDKVPTRSNVDDKVFSDILQRYNLGVVDKNISGELKKLLMFRNAIAHGDNSIPVEETNVDEFVNLVHTLMALVYEKIDYAVSNKTYIRTGESF